MSHKRNEKLNKHINTANRICLSFPRKRNTGGKIISYRIGKRNVYPMMLENIIESINIISNKYTYLK